MLDGLRPLVRGDVRLRLTRIALGLTLAASAFGLAAAGRMWARGEPPRPPERVSARVGAGASARVDFAMAPTVDPTRPLAGELPRRVLAFYDPDEHVLEEDDHLVEHERAMDAEVAPPHRLAELPLNHLGLVVDYRDVHAPLPGADEMRAYVGVLAWFTDDTMREPDRWLDWLAAQLDAGRKVVVIEHLGAYQGTDGQPASPERLARVLAGIGGRLLDDSTDDASVISVVSSDPRMIGFEQALPARLALYQHWRAHPEARVFLRLERTDVPDSQSDVVWVGPGGGLIMPSLAVAEARLGERYVTRWLVDPFRFFEAAFGVEGWPRPDFTTLNGRRIFYSQIDGDGMEQISELDHLSLCGAVVRDQVLHVYDLPFTASVVVGYTAPPPLGKGSDVEVAVARSIFALDNVEVGSHGLAHPMDWRAGAAAELSVPDLPGYALSGEQEIAASVRYIDDELAPPGKPCKIMLWTGWCNPTTEQLAVAYRLGLRNLNGGDPRLDDHYPSIAHLVPPVHQVGGLFQFYTSAANDYILTEGWLPPYYRYRNVVQTFERSGSPRRLLPVDVYFHFYIGRNRAGLTGLLETLEWATAEPLAPMFTSAYVDVVRDFHWARIARAADGTWTVRKGAALRTLRVDDPAFEVDLARSRGVIGLLHVPALGATYLHLDGSTEVIVRPGKGPPTGLHLVEASHVVDGLAPRGRGFTFSTEGVGRRTFVLGGLAPGASYRGPDGEAVAVDADGRLTLAMPGGPARVVVDVQAESP